MDHFVPLAGHRLSFEEGIDGYMHHLKRFRVQGTFQDGPVADAGALLAFDRRQFAAAHQQPFAAPPEIDSGEQLRQIRFQRLRDGHQHRQRRNRAEVLDFGNQPGGQPGRFRQLLKRFSARPAQFPEPGSESDQLFSHHFSCFFACNE
ncbi:hypothetical protein SDC9_140989 [bioreactor metagenome]|uniref:Uncharacterized protein n=1 Tax=bioreactor metagenome TaxID=1076179 RepID=A0A645DWU5_9ZZZZ